MEIRTLQTTLDGFDFELKKSADAEKISSHQRLVSPGSILSGIPSTLSTPTVAEENQPAVSLLPIDMNQWESSTVEDHYWVVVTGRERPVLVNCDAPETYFQDLIGA
jgi:hypothetical protein